MFPPRLVQFVALSICAALLVAASRLMPSIQKGRDGLTMHGSDKPAENTPPEYVLAIQVLGPLRGLLTDVAFIRAEQFKEKGRFYDAQQLFEWICALQPRFPSVWEFAAWNLAWNISVTTYTPEERWQWVYNGATLLRDKGIPNNPRAVNLYKQLAWTFCNKMSESIDDYNLVYKANWAWRMQLLLGPPPPITEAVRDIRIAGDDFDPLQEAMRLTDFQNEAKRKRLAELRGQQYKPSTPAGQGATAPPAAAAEVAGPSAFDRARKVAYDRIEKIAQAPDTLEQLYEQVPETRTMVERLRDIGVDVSNGELTEAEYWQRGGPAWTFFERFRKLADPQSMMVRIARGTTRPAADADSDLAKFDEILGVSTHNPAGEALVRFLQKKVLNEVYEMDPAHMAYLIKTFGPLDWRSVDAAGLYWVTLGIIRGGETVSTFQNDKTNTARLIFFCLRNLWLRGRITFEPYPDRDKIYLSYLTLTPDENMIESMQWAYTNFARMLDPDPGEQKGVGETYRAGHINFLTEAIRMLYISGREAEAAKYYAYLQENYPLRPDGSPNPDYQKTLYDFVIGDFYSSIAAMSIREATIAIAAMLESGLNELAEGDATRYERLLKRAAQIHAQYMKDKQSAIASPGKVLPPFDQLLTDVFGVWLSQPYAHPSDTMRKVRVWLAADPVLRQRVYDALLPGFTAECEYWDFDVARAFPEPPGMEEYRKANPTRFRPEDDQTESLPMKNE